MRRCWPILVLMLAGCAGRGVSTPAQASLPALVHDAATQMLYVATGDCSEPILALDPQTGKAIPGVPASPEPWGCVQQNVFGVGPDGNVYFSNSNALVELSAQLTLVRTAPLPKFGIEPFSIAFTSLNVFLGDAESGKLGVYPLGLNGKMRLETTVANDTSLMTSSGSTLFALSFEKKTITRLKPPYSGGTTLATIPGAGGGTGIAVTSTNQLYAASSDTAPIVYQLKGGGKAKPIATLSQTSSPVFALDARGQRVRAGMHDSVAQRLPGSVLIFAPGATQPFATAEKNQECYGLTVRGVRIVLPCSATSSIRASTRSPPRAAAQRCCGAATPSQG